MFIDFAEERAAYVIRVGKRGLADVYRSFTIIFCLHHYGRVNVFSVADVCLSSGEISCFIIGGRMTNADCSMCDDTAEESAPSIIKVAEMKQSITSLLTFQSKLFPHYCVDKCNPIGVPKLNRNGKPPSSVQINLRTLVSTKIHRPEIF